MRRDQLEHLIRAAAAITGSERIYVFGSQAALASVEMLPGVASASMEADLFIEDRRTLDADEPTYSDLVTGALGEGSLFHETHGYYAEGVGAETPVLPFGWENRAMVIQGQATQGAAGVCPELHDLVLSKYVRNEDKDRAYIGALIESGYIDQATLAGRIEQMPEERLSKVGGRDGLRQRVAAHFRGAEADESPSP